eukprot:4358516-Pyramimonas_sp.AAC.1
MCALADNSAGMTRQWNEQTNERMNQPTNQRFLKGKGAAHARAGLRSAPVGGAHGETAERARGWSMAGSR